MLRFRSTEFEKEVKDCLSFIKENEKGRVGLGLEFYDINSDKFDPLEYDVEINEDYMVSISPDYSEIEDAEITLRELINLINETKNAEIVDGKTCITEKRCLIRVTPDYYKDLYMFEILFENKKKLFEIGSEINDLHFTCSLVRGLTIFGLAVHFLNDFNKYYPSVSDGDMFLEIVFDQPLSRDAINKIVNAYIFELDSSHNIKIGVNPRADEDFDDVNEKELIEKEYLFRPLLFGCGIYELLNTFVISEDYLNNYDYSIIQYVKVIEYVSQTVIRQEITKRAQNKLVSPRALVPDANYIRELEILFIDFKNKYDTDRGAIKITLKNCCDIFEIIDYAPKYLENIVNLKERLKNTKANKDGIIEAAYDLLADSISDTRNHIAHAKASYSLKGNECPDDQKREFVNVLRSLAIQTIRWFSNTSEGDRIVPE